LPVSLLPLVSCALSGGNFLAGYDVRSTYITRSTYYPGKKHRKTATREQYRSLGMQREAVASRNIRGNDAVKEDGTENTFRAYKWTEYAYKR